MTTILRATLLQAILLAFCASGWSADVPLNAFPQEVQQRMHKRLKGKFDEEKSNCFNTSLYVLGFETKVEYTDGYDIEYFLQSALEVSPTPGSLVCRSVDVQNGEPVQFGDFGVIGQVLFKKGSVLAHTFIVLNENEVFEKAGIGASNPVKLTPLSQALKPYFEYETPNYGNIQKDLLKAVGCTQGAIQKYRDEASFYNVLPASCEIFRCQPRK